MIHRLKHSFTAGELSPLMYDRHDFDRHRNGCRKLRNMICVTQGPVTIRPGLRFIYDMEAAGVDQHATDKRMRMIRFVFNEDQAYAMLFYIRDDSMPCVVFCTGDGLLTDTGTIVQLPLEADFDIENFDYAQSGDDMYIAQASIQPSKISRTSLYVWTYANITFSSQPAEWAAPDSWPRKVVFHQQRLVYGGSLTNRQKIWMSDAGDFTSFTTPTESSHSVAFTLASGTQNKIQWLVSGRNLLTGTVGDEWTVSGGGYAPITYQNILSQRQTTNGSEGIKPLSIGLTALFLEQHARVVNEFTYDYTSDSYKNMDITVLAPHLTEFYQIVDWTYQKTPDRIIWSIRSDGALLGTTYQKQHKVIGWHSHDTQGEFKVITCVPGEEREDDVWTVVKRNINGSDKYYIEKLSSFQSITEAEWGRFLDSHLVYNGAATTTMTGLTHLANEVVNILADGTVHPPVTVSVAGEVSLNNEYSHIVVGLPYVAEVWPLTTMVTDDSGSSIGRMQRILNVNIDLYRSLGMSIGRYDTEEEKEVVEEVPFRVPTDLTGQAVPLHSGIFHIDFPEGYDRDSVYFIRQEQPLPLTVRSATDVIEVTE